MIVREKIDVAVSSAGIAAQILYEILSMEDEIDRNKEHFWVIGLNTKNKVLFVDLISLGTLDQALVHPREVFRLAISKGVFRIIVGHNHPSGDPEPSPDDISLTERLKKAGDILGIELLDHVIIAGENCMSFKERGIV